jgi:hypothetical protein
MTDKREINEWDLVTLAEMVYGLKTKSAAFFAKERARSAGVSPEEFLNGALELLQAGPFSNNHRAAERLVDEVKGHLARS